MGKRPLLWAFLVTAFLIFISGMAGWLTCPPLPWNEGESVSLHGTVEEVIQRENGQQIRLSKVSIPSNISYQGQVLVYENQKSLLKIGYQVKVTGEYQALKEATNPGQFDQKSYYEAQGIRMIIKNAGIVVENDHVNYIRQGLFILRTYLSGVIREIAEGEESGLFTAMLLGEKGELKKEQKELYQSGGISHILAISGLHISLLGMLAYKLFRKLKRGYGCSVIVSGSFMVAYGLLVGFGVSAKRAILMFLVFLLGEFLGESYDVVSSLSFVGILLLLREPRILFQCSFQLSFLSVGAVGLLYPAVMKNRKRKGAESLTLGLCVTLLTLPCTLYWFYEFAPYGILLNLCVIPLVPVVFLSGLLGMVFGCLSVPAGIFLAGPGVGVLKIFHLLLTHMETLPGSRLIVGRPAFWRIAVYYGLLLLAVFGKLSRKNKGIIRGLLMAAGLFVLCFRGKAVSSVTFLDVGQGDSIFIRTERGTTLLIDGGSSTVSEVGKYRILPFLKVEGVSHLDYLFLTHMDEDHINGARELLEDQFHGIPIERLCLADTKGDEAKETLIKDAKRFGTEVLRIRRGVGFQEKGFSLHCLYPEKGGNGDGKNENSLVLLADFSGKKVLLTGDLEGAGEEELLALGIPEVDVLKVAHHGSKGATSEELLLQAGPEIAVISVGEGNRYHHPAPELLGRLQAFDTKLFRTDRSGAVGIEFWSSGMRLREYVNHR